MNTKQLKSRSLLLLAVLLIASTAISWGAKPESIKKKEISKSFDVSLSDLLMTDNRYCKRLKPKVRMLHRLASTV